MTDSKREIKFSMKAFLAFFLTFMLSLSFLAYQINTLENTNLILSERLTQLEEKQTELQSFLEKNYGVSSLEELEQKLKMRYTGNPFTTELWSGQLQAENITGMHWYTYRGGSLLNRTDVIAYPEQTATFIIFGKDTDNDGTYDIIYAKNTTSGQIQFGGEWDASGVDGANASATMRAALGSCSGGESIFIKRGTYPINTQLYTTKAIDIVGEVGTVLDWQGTGSCIMVNQTGMSWTETCYLAAFKIESLAITLHSDGQRAITLYECKVQPIVSRVTVKSLVSGATDLIGIHVYGYTAKPVIEKCRILGYDKTGEGIRLESNGGSPNVFSIINSRSISGWDIGINIMGGTYGVIARNAIEHNNVGVKLHIPLNTIHDNFFENNVNYDVWLNYSGKADPTILYRNGLKSSVKVYNPNSQPIIARDNILYVTENSGFAIVANGEYIAHGIDSTLNIGQSNSSVLITEYTKVYDGVPVTVGCDFVNGTHFRVAVYWTNGTAITDDAVQIWWRVEYTG